MSTLLSALAEPQKKPFQLYIVEHGIERLTVKIPLHQVAAFEKSASGIKDKQSIMSIVAGLGGKVCE